MQKGFSTFIFLTACFLLHGNTVQAQLYRTGVTTFTKTDSLRGSLTPERTWWDVLRYEVVVKPDFNTKIIAGSNEIRYKVTKTNNGKTKMQIDLQPPLVIDSVVFNGKKKLKFEKYDKNVWYINTPAQQLNEENRVNIYYHGKVHEAVRPPWDGGFIFTKDAKSRPWMTTSCQGLGASIWYPNKDHQSDEPDKGASLTMIVPDTLVGVANGRLVLEKNNNDGTKTYKYNVVNPINNYLLTPYIGKYVNFNQIYQGKDGNLTLNYWVMDYNLEKAKNYMPGQVTSMLQGLEHWFGPYPFYEDGYQLIDVSYTGMEHQSAVSYGNQYKFGYLGKDGSNSGWGHQFDFIIIHESGHEWFGNNITSKDLGDMWIHEGFTNYSETLYVDYIFGKQAANEYNYGIRSTIKNDVPIVGPYNVNKEGSKDMYRKGGNFLHTLRHSINNDELFRKILNGLGAAFRHQTVTTKQIEDYISEQSGFDYSIVFNQYLRTVQIPTLEFKLKDGKVTARYTNCLDGFNLPLALQKKDGKSLKIYPSTEWRNFSINEDEAALFKKQAIEFMYYLNVKGE